MWLSRSICISSASNSRDSWTYTPDARALSIIVSARMPRPLATTRGAASPGRLASAAAARCLSGAVIVLHRQAVERAAGVGQPLRQLSPVLLQQGLGFGLFRHHPDAECLVSIELDVHGQVAELWQAQFEMRFPACSGVVGRIGVRLPLLGIGFLAQMPFQWLARPDFPAPDELRGLQH